MRDAGLKHRLLGAGFAALCAVALAPAARAQASVGPIVRAARQGNVGAQAYLGSLYLSGNGVPLNDAAAAHWFGQAARQGDAVAETNLGLLYQTGRGVPRNPVLAAHWYRQAARQGDANAENDLGQLYQLGQGVPPDTAKAIYWYQRSSAQGNLAAQRNLTALNAYLAALKASQARQQQ